jgi:hypothetical protein
MSWFVRLFAKDVSAVCDFSKPRPGMPALDEICAVSGVLVMDIGSLKKGTQFKLMTITMLPNKLVQFNIQTFEAIQSTHIVTYNLAHMLDTSAPQ